MTTHVAFLWHINSNVKRAFTADTDIAAEDRVYAWLMAYTADFRDHDDYPTDEAWLDRCFEDGWEFDTAEVE